MESPRTFWSHGITVVEPKLRQMRDRAQELQNNWEPVGHRFCRGSHLELWNLWSHQGPSGPMGPQEWSQDCTSGAEKLQQHQKSGERGSAPREPPESYWSRGTTLVEPWEPQNAPVELQSSGS